MTPNDLSQNEFSNTFAHKKSKSTSKDNSKNNSLNDILKISSNALAMDGKKFMTDQMKIDETLSEQKDNLVPKWKPSEMSVYHLNSIMKPLPSIYSGAQMLDQQQKVR